MALIDPDAPVFATAEAVVAASPRQVWDVLSDVAGWPAWNPAVRSATISGDLRAGATFRWAAGPGTIHSRVAEVESPRLLAWTGRSMGLGACQVWRIEEHAGGCTVTTEETFAGIVARLLASRLRRSVQRDLDTWVQLLKLEAETRAAEWAAAAREQERQVEGHPPGSGPGASAPRNGRSRRSRRSGASTDEPSTRAERRS